jgi:fructosamine-3-kinase
MTAFSQRVAALTGVAEDRLERLAGGDLSEVLLVRRPGMAPVVAKGGPAIATEAAMLRALAGAGVPTPAVEGEHDGVLLIAYVENDGVMNANAWAETGAAVRALHARTGAAYGWPVDYALGTVALDNREGRDWPRFWGEQRLAAAAALLDRPLRARIERLAGRMAALLPAEPPAAFLHGDLWTGNILVAGGGLAALVDPACYHGDAEVDLAMLALFGTPPAEFWEGYGPRAPGHQARLPVYQLFPALVHLRLFGASYRPMVERLLAAAGG